MNITDKNIKTILSYFKGINITADDDINNDNYLDFFTFAPDVQKKIKWTNSGVSKLVFNFSTFPDIVVKIPFTSYSCSKTESRYTYIKTTDGHYIAVTNSAYYLSESFENTYLSAPVGMEKEIQRCWDYCEVETLLYQYAEQHNSEQFLAETRLIGFIGEDNDYPVYVQDIARIYDHCGELCYNLRNAYDINKSRKFYSLEEKSFDKMVEDYFILQGKKNVIYTFYSLYKAWAIDFYLYYGLRELLQLCVFIANSGISDLHSENIGYINHRPALIDYASFNS